MSVSDQSSAEYERLVAALRENALAALYERAEQIRPDGRITGIPEQLVDAVLSVCDDLAIEQMADHYINEYRQKSIKLRNGELTMGFVPSAEMVAHWVGAAEGYLNGAVNYRTVTMEVKLAGQLQRYEFRLERHEFGKLTPHEARQRAENALKHVQDMLAGHPRSPVAREVLAYLQDAVPWDETASPGDRDSAGA